MKIGHYNLGIWQQGGIASYIRRVSEVQRALGHEVVFFDASPSAAAPEAGWEVRGVRTDRELFTAASDLRLDVLHLHTAVAEVPADNRRMAVVRTVHVHEPYCPSATQFLFRSNAPCSHGYQPLRCLHGYLFEHCGSLRPANLVHSLTRFRHERRTLPAIRTLAISEFLKRRLIEAGYPEQRIAVLRPMAPAGVDYVPPPAGEVPRFLFAGRLVPQKGLQWLFRALQRVRVPCRLDVAGDGYARERLQREAENLHLQDRVRFHGWLQRDALDSLFRSARAVVFPSLWQEPAGLVPLEAMAHGRAVIASRVGGACEPIDDGSDGLVVEPGDVDRLAAALERLAGEFDLARRLGIEGRRKALENFSISSHVAQLHRHYAGGPMPDEQAACRQ